MILIVDDEINISTSLKEYLVSEGYQCLVSANATEALEVLENSNKIKVVISDLKMPKMNGLELIKQYKKTHPHSFVQFIMITGFNDANTMRLGFKEGLVDYLYKPITLSEIKSAVEKGLENFQLALAKLQEAEENSRKLNHAQILITKKHLDMIQLMMKMIQARDKYTEEHCKRVSEIAGIISERLGLKVEQAARIKLASMLHDVGKIAVPDSILLKPGPLTVEEYEQVKFHSKKGYEIVNGYVDNGVSSLILHHHEYYNGKGYPLGLKAKGIPLGARIIAIGDQYDALRSDRPYRKALTAEQAYKLMLEDIDVKFDRQIMEVFLAEIPQIEAKLYAKQLSKEVS